MAKTRKSVSVKRSASVKKMKGGKKTRKSVSVKRSASRKH